MNDKRVIVALDNMPLAEAATMANAVKEEAAGVKAGFELLCAEGAGNIAAAFKPSGLPCFFDPKLHDIPNTAAQAAKKLARHGAWIINLHASGGRKMMQAVRTAVDEVWENEPEKYGLTRKPLVIAVTVLTSLDYDQLTEVLLPIEFVRIDPEDNASNFVPREMSSEDKAQKLRVITLKMALLAEECNLDGIVTSPQEVALIREKMSHNPNFQIITPGIRLESGDANDQVRIATPAGAIEAGADWLVIGRPVTRSENPKETLRRINEQVAEALAKKGAVAK